MPKLLLVLTVAAIGLFPLSVSAQESAPAVPPVEQVIEGIDSSRLVAIGAGLLIGAITMEVLVAGDLAILAGAVTGGVLTDWWYRKRETVSMVPKAAYSFAGDPVSPGLFKLAMLPRQ
jgi:hypothetical protein